MLENFRELEPKRHKGWLERLLVASPLGMLLGALLVIFTPNYIAYGTPLPQDENQLSSIFIVGGAFILNLIASRSLNSFPGGNKFSYQLVLTLAVIALSLAIVLALRIGHARQALFLGFSLLVLFQALAVYFKGRFRYTKFAVVPGGKHLVPEQIDNMRLFTLETPSSERRFDALVADLEAPLNNEWLRFIALNNSRGLPVLDAKYLSESVHGRVALEQLNSSDIQALQPKAPYQLFKRYLDIFGALLLAPLALPLCLVIATLIRLESKGPALFVQQRVGQGNKPFKMLKFRSMRQEGSTVGARFADDEEHRITRLGRILRKSRLDELPQLWNVLTGTMSLIGPRPEQPAFAEEFDAKVAFYSYRHIIKPGITGWAQVQQGYVSELEETRIKVEHDFYYIKHLSLSLDLLVAMKTIRTVLSGFGAR